MRIVANALTAFRVVCAILVPVLIFTETWATAALLFGLGYLSDAADGEIVRRAGLPDDPRGAQWDKAADLALTILPLAALVIEGKVPVWVAVCMALGTLVILKYVYTIPKESKLFVIHWHVHYLHPFLYAVLLGYMLVVMTVQATANVVPWIAGYMLVALVVGLIKRDRIKMFFSGPKG